MAGVKGKSGRKANEAVIRQNLLIALDELDPMTGRKRMLNLIAAWIEAAENGDTTAIRDIVDRIDGKPTQRSEVTGPDGDAIPHKLTVTFE